MHLKPQDAPPTLLLVLNGKRKNFMGIIKRGRRIPVVRDMRDIFLVDINPVTPTFTRITNKGVNTSFRRVYAERVNHGRFRYKPLPYRMLHSVSSAHSLALIHVSILRNVMYLRKVLDNANRLRLSKVFDLNRVIHR